MKFLMKKKHIMLDTVGWSFRRDNSEWDPQTFQRAVDTYQIPWDIAPTNISFTGQDVTVDWNDGAKTTFSCDFLMNWAYCHEHDPRGLYGKDDKSSHRYSIASNTSNGDSIRQFGLFGGAYTKWWAFDNEKEYQSTSPLHWDTNKLGECNSHTHAFPNSTGHLYWSSTLSSKPMLPSIKYDDVFNKDAGLHDWLTAVARYGFCCVEGVPPTMEATEEVCR